MKNYWLDRRKERIEKVEKQKEVITAFPKQIWQLIKQRKTRRKGP